MSEIDLGFHSSENFGQPQPKQHNHFLDDNAEMASDATNPFASIPTGNGNSNESSGEASNSNSDRNDNVPFQVGQSTTSTRDIAQATQTPRVLDFDPGSFDTAKSQIFLPQPVFLATAPPRTHTFAWNVSDRSLLVTRAKWLWETPSKAEEPLLEFEMNKDSCQELCPSSLILNWDIALARGTTAGFHHIHLDWTTNTRNGSTKSRLFGIAQSVEEQQAVSRDLSVYLGDPRNVGKNDTREEIAEGSNSFGGGTLPTTTGTVAPTASNNPATLSAPSSGGISTPAVVGIAVGCAVAGIIVIALLVWFLWFRRRRAGKGAHEKVDHVGDLPYGSEGHVPGALPNEYMVDKESHHAVVADSPHSPYSDDGHVRSDAAILAATQHPAMQQYHHQQPYVPSSQQQQQQQPESAGYVPYTDVPATYSPVAATATTAAVPSSPHESSRARSATPQGVSSSVAHLVEEGMTAEQIRRLEEEERQLDEAIERAGRR